MDYNSFAADISGTKAVGINDAECTAAVCEKRRHISCMKRVEVASGVAAVFDEMPLCIRKRVFFTAAAAAFSRMYMKAQNPPGRQSFYTGGNVYA